MNLIPDSSFFICFFDDLDELMDTSTLNTYFSVFSANFNIKITPLVNEEITKCKSDLYKKHSSKFNIIDRDDFFLYDGHLLELLRPLVGRGEFEVISLAKYYQENGLNDFTFILDDNEARLKIKRYFQELDGYLKGTVGIIMFCCLDMELFNKKESIHILNCINNSKFYVDPNIIENVINTIKLS